MSSLKPICKPCQRFYRPEKNGFMFIEGMPNGKYSSGPTPAGADFPQYWEPYKLWRGDLWKCQGCGSEIIVGVAWEPIREHYQPDFEEVVEKLGIKYQVNDC